MLVAEELAVAAVRLTLPFAATVPPAQIECRAGCRQVAAEADLRYAADLDGAARHCGDVRRVDAIRAGSARRLLGLLSAQAPVSACLNRGALRPHRPHLII